MNIFVGALPHGITEDELKAKFEEFGRVISVKIIVDRYTGQSKGFGFVEMDNTQEAKTAISELNGKDLNGKNIAVSEARPRENRSGNNSRDGGFRNNNSGGRRY